MAEYEKQIEARHGAGLSAPEEDRPPYVIGLNFPRKIEIIADRLLKQGYSAAVAEKVVGANFARVFQVLCTTYPLETTNRLPRAECTPAILGRLP